jgi:dinuclear metal center YbgI/SA1388 family protein
MKIRELTDYLESFAPLAYQESYDNCGLIVGSADTEVNRALIALDCTEDVVLEAINLGCNLIISHHPIVFTGLKRLNGNSYVERTIILAIQHQIAIYAVHTNLDNVRIGVNSGIAQKLNLQQTQILAPKSAVLGKLVTFVPHDYVGKVKDALFLAGAGKIGNYSHCSFSSTGSGTFTGNKEAKPFVGESNHLHTEAETRIEVVFPQFLKGKIVTALKKSHPYEEPAYDLYSLLNENQEVGSGLIGFLPTEMSPTDFLSYLKQKMELKLIRHTVLSGKNIIKVAICGGSGSFLLKQAIACNADAYVSADFKYHEFFDAENKLMIADIGHYESEKFTNSLICELILEKFPTFAILLSKIDTNPVNYYL